MLSAYKDEPNSAWDSLQGNGPPEGMINWPGRFLLLLRHYQCGLMTTEEVEAFFSELQLVLQGMQLCLDPAGDSEIQLVLRRRKPGKPVNKKDLRRKKLAAAQHVETLRAAGIEKQEAAIQEAMDSTGLSRSEIFEGLKWRRSAFEDAAKVREALKPK